MAAAMPAPPSADTAARLAQLNPMLRLLAMRGEIRRYRKGALLIQEGDRGDTLYVLLSGQVRVFSENAAGREITFGLYGPGEYLGEMSLDGGPRSASVEVQEVCTCSVVPRATLENFIAEQPAFAFDLLSKVIRRARAATLTARQLALNDVYGRLRQHLLDASANYGGNTLPRPTHRELAGLLGCSREMVSRLMKDLEIGGYVEVTPRELRITGALPARW